MGGVLADEAAALNERWARTVASAARWSRGSSPPRSTGAAPPPTARASGSPARRRGPTCTPCGRHATPSSPAPAPSSSTTRASPCARDRAVCRWARSRPTAVSRRGRVAGRARVGSRPRRARERCFTSAAAIRMTCSRCCGTREFATSGSRAARRWRRVPQGRARRRGLCLPRAGPARRRPSGGGGSRHHVDGWDQATRHRGRPARRRRPPHPRAIPRPVDVPASGMGVVHPSNRRVLVALDERA